MTHGVPIGTNNMGQAPLNLPHGAKMDLFFVWFNKALKTLNDFFLVFLFLLFIVILLMIMVMIMIIIQHEAWVTVGERPLAPSVKKRKQPFHTTFSVLGAW